ncbi:MAG: hypothetical protein Q8J72_05120 [Rhodocyclaceae bacterium]|nr:hypothetical protein [Rhodocyclaceae bacterium]
MHRTQGDFLVESDQPPAVPDSQAEQIQVGDLSVAMDMRVVEALIIQQTHVVGPEFMAKVGAGGTARRHQ